MNATARMHVAAGLAALSGIVMAVSYPGRETGVVHASQAPVTWRQQIGPLVYKNCTSCHHAGGSGPFSLTTYQDAKRRGGLMKTVTASRYMPPWLPAAAGT